MTKARTPPSSDDFCQCGYRSSAHPTPAGCKSYRRSVGLNMQVGDDGFWDEARLWRDNTRDKGKQR